MTGAIFDSWGEGFSFERWEKAVRDAGLDLRFYAERERSFEETEPWEVVDYGIRKSFLKREYMKAMKAEVTLNCRQQCSGCGINQFCGRECFAND